MGNRAIFHVSTHKKSTNNGKLNQQKYWIPLFHVFNTQKTFKKNIYFMEFSWLIYIHLPFLFKKAELSPGSPNWAVVFSVWEGARKRAKAKKGNTCFFGCSRCICWYMGVSENSVPLNPMVLLILIPIKWLFHWEYTLFSDKPKYSYTWLIYIYNIVIYIYIIW